METAEQTAFVEAYERCVASAPKSYVEQFVQRQIRGQDTPYDEYYTSVMDAWCLWHEATAYTRYNRLLRAIKEIYSLIHPDTTPSGDEVSDGQILDMIFDIVSPIVQGADK